LMPNSTTRNAPSVTVVVSVSTDPSFLLLCWKLNAKRCGRLLILFTSDSNQELQSLTHGSRSDIMGSWVPTPVIRGLREQMFNADTEKACVRQNQSENRLKLAPHVTPTFHSRSA
jgi:hypothetical protein